MWLAYAGDLLMGLALLCGFLVVLRKYNPWVACCGSAFLWLGVCALLAYAHATDARQILGVFERSHAGLAWWYRLASLWTYFDGSFTLWTACLAATSLLRYFTHKNRMPSEAFGWALVLLGHGLILFLSAHPFAYLTCVPTEGAGFTPTLHAAHVVFHPPIMYAGLALLALPALQSMTCSFAPDQIELCKSYSRLAYVVMTLGLAWGGIWAYTELGWGGMWFWDPVETMALIPWVAHLLVWHLWPRHAERAWQWAPLPFSLALFQVWGVRSGWITSVHSFARDDEKGWLLLIGSCLFTGVFLWHIQKTRTKSPPITCALFGVIIAIMMVGIAWPMVAPGIPDMNWFHGMLLPCIAAGAWFSTPQRDRLWLSGITLLAMAGYSTTPDPTWMSTSAWCIGLWMAAGAWRLAQGQRLGHFAFGLLLMSLAWKATWSYEFKLTSGESFHGWHLEHQNTTTESTPFGDCQTDHVSLNNQPTTVTTETYKNGTIMRRMGTIVGWWSHWQVMPAAGDSLTPSYIVGYRHGIHGVWGALVLLLFAFQRRRKKDHDRLILTG